MASADVSWAAVAPEGVPSELKPIQSQLQRAREIAPHDPAIAYWLLFAAAQDGLRIHPSSPEARKLLAALVGALEQSKTSESIRDSPLVADNQVAQRHVRTFALGVFARADNEDRAGQATRNTARSFLAAATFLDLVRLFPEKDEGDAQDKIKYAKWKAADIGKALREGRTPAPGPPGWDPAEEQQAQDALKEARDAIAQAEVDQSTTADAETAPLDPSEEAELAREMDKLLGITGASQDTPAALPDAPSAPLDSPAALSDAGPSLALSDTSPSLPGVPSAPPGVPKTPLTTTLQRSGSGEGSTEEDTGEPKRRPPLPVPPPEPSPPSTERAHSSRPLPTPPGPSAPARDLSDATVPSVPSISPVPSAPTGRPIPLFPTAPPAFPDAPSAPSAPPAPPVQSKPSAPPEKAREASAAVSASAPSSATLPLSLAPQQTAQVQKLAKYAASALDFDDLDTARRELAHALAILNGER